MVVIICLVYFIGVKIEKNIKPLFNYYVYQQKSLKLEVRGKSHL